MSSPKHQYERLHSADGIKIEQSDSKLSPSRIDRHETETNRNIPDVPLQKLSQGHRGHHLQSYIGDGTNEAAENTDYAEKSSDDAHLSTHRNTTNATIEDANIDKMPFTEDGLDQEIQRAIAQHDLQQKQLQQSSTDGLGDAVDLNRAEPHKESINNMEASHYTANTQQMDSPEEKRHLQMIANELKRVTSSEESSGHEQGPTNRDIRHFSNLNGDYEEILHHNYDLHVDFEHNSDSVNQFAQNHSRHSTGLNINADAQVVLRGAHIPPDSELLATNTALAAYNALSSHVPPVALLASVHLTALPLPIVASDHLPARIQLLIGTLPVLDNLASQLLRYFAVGPYQKIIDLASNPDTALGAVFRDLASLFEVAKRLYSEEDPFITVEHLAPGVWKEGDQTLSIFRNREQTIESTLRKVNLATFLSATLGLLEAGFFHLNEAFLSVFCPHHNLDPANSMSNMSPSNMNLQSYVGSIIGEKVGKIFKPQASLYLDLKTQAFISGLLAGERSREAILEDVFPNNMEEILLKKRGVKTLSPTELDFVNRCKSRKDMLLKSATDNFSEQYEWYAFLKDLFGLVSKDMSVLIWGKKIKASARQDKSLNSSRASALHTSLTSHSDNQLHNHPNTPDAEDTVARAQDNNTNAGVPASQEIKDITAGLLPSEIQEQQIHLRINPNITGRSLNRRPWTREEEKALRYALELKGPHWSTILELFGQGGRINESLKNRNQVQLKDKARNWKMFFLKSRLPVPEYLKKVTGDLDREDKLKAKIARSRKTAAAPVPAVSKRDDSFDADYESVDTKRHKV